MATVKARHGGPGTLEQSAGKFVGRASFDKLSCLNADSGRRRCPRIIFLGNLARLSLEGAFGLSEWPRWRAGVGARLHRVLVPFCGASRV